MVAAEELAEAGGEDSAAAEGAGAGTGTGG